MFFFNHNSFVILSLFIWLVTVVALRQRGWPQPSWMILAGLAVVLAAAYFLFRPASATSTEAAEIRAKIGQGMPVLLEFQSQN